MGLKLLGFPLSFDNLRHESLASAARLAREIVVLRQQIESLVLHVFRIALAEARLGYVECENSGVVKACVEIGLCVAQVGGSEAEIVAAINEDIRAAICRLVAETP
jgi:hypothetical protein